MGECVVRMEMPSKCERCPMCGTASGGNGMYKLWCMCGDIPASAQRIPGDCPILCQLPEGHGRLVDKDEVIESIRTEMTELFFNGMKGTPRPTDDLRMMWNRLEDEDLTPTIVPAERSET